MKRWSVDCRNAFSHLPVYRPQTEQNLHCQYWCGISDFEKELQSIYFAPESNRSVDPGQRHQIDFSTHNHVYLQAEDISLKKNKIQPKFSILFDKIFLGYVIQYKKTFRNYRSLMKRKLALKTAQNISNSLLFHKMCRGYRSINSIRTIWKIKMDKNYEIFVVFGVASATAWLFIFTTVNNAFRCGRNCQTNFFFLSNSCRIRCITLQEH